MTQNKFWLVRGLNIEKKHENKEQAEYSAKELAKEHASEFGVFELVSSFKGVVTKTVNVIETLLEVTPKETLAVTEQDDIISVKPVLGLPTIDETPKFKIGDIVTINAIGFKGEKFEITYCVNDIDNYYYDVKNIENQDERSHGINECDITLAEPTVDKTETVKPKFKVGDIVNHKHYGKCTIQQFNCIGSQGAWYAVTNKESPEWFCIKEEKLTLAEPETPKHEFKIGDRVYLDNYFDCIVDDYIDETKSYKVSFMGSGGYAIVNKVRVSHRKQ
jgi:exosome complex RNA-binding protein Csl4